MTPTEYEQKAMGFCNVKDNIITISLEGHQAPADENVNRPQLLHGVLGISSEAGEFANMMKRTLNYDRPVDKLNVLEESGDLLWYLVRALSACGFTLEQAMAVNIAKLTTRNKGEKFNLEATLNRDTDAEATAMLETLNKIIAGEKP